MTWLSGWSYRKKHTITGSSGAGTNYQIPINVYYGTGTDSGNNVYLNSKSNVDFSDIRFTSSDGSTTLDYWIESKTDSSMAKIWIEVLSDLGVNVDIYLYYGNVSTTSLSNGENTFLFFDDFNDSSFNTTKWQQHNGTGLSESSGLLSVNSSGDPGKIIAKTAPTGNNYCFRSRFYTSGSGGDERAGLSIKTNISSGQGYNYVAHNFDSNNEWRFLDDGVVWGSIYETSWSENTWYTSEIYHDGSNIKARRNDTSWRSWARSGRAGYPALNFGSYNATTKFDWALVRKIIATEPSNGAWYNEEVGQKIFIIS